MRLLYRLQVWCNEKKKVIFTDIEEPCVSIESHISLFLYGLFASTVNFLVASAHHKRERKQSGMSETPLAFLHVEFATPLHADYCNWLKNADFHDTMAYSKIRREKQGWQKARRASVLFAF